MMAGHLLHSGGEGGIGEERHKLRSETCVSYWVRLADSLILTGKRHWHKGWRQYEDNKIILRRVRFQSVCLCADCYSFWAGARSPYESSPVGASSITSQCRGKSRITSASDSNTLLNICYITFHHICVYILCLLNLTRVKCNYVLFLCITGNAVLQH